MNSPTGPWDVALIDLFRSEVETHSESLNAALLALERAPGDTSRIDEMMRAAHSIKGASRVVGVEPAVLVAHVMEDCFVAAQKGAVQLKPADVDVLLRGVDLLGNISTATRDPEANLSEAFGKDVQTIVSELRDVLAGKVATAEPRLSAAQSVAAMPVHTAASEVTLSFPALLDAAAAEELRRQLLLAVDSPYTSIRFDLSATKNLDLQGLALLAAAPRYLAEHSRSSLQLAGVSSEMAMVLRITGLDTEYGMGDLPMRGGALTMETRANEFVTEAREHLTVLEQILLTLENSRGSADERERLDHSLRIVHSLKGDAGFLGFTAIRTLANSMESVLEALRDQAVSNSAAGIEALLVARDRLAVLLDDLEHGRAADLGEILVQLESVTRSPTAAKQDWEINLRELDPQRGGRLVEWFRTFERCGVVSDARVELPPHDLAQRLPQGTILYRARLQSSSPMIATRRMLGLPPDAKATPQENAISLSIDLGQWAAARQCGLATLFAELDGVGQIDRPQLVGMTADLGSLPAENVVLQGLLHTSLTEAEVDQLLRLPPNRSLATGLKRDADSPTLPVISSSVVSTSTAPDADKPTTLRIQVELLDRLMTLIGELTLVRNQSLLMFGEEAGRPRPILQRLNGVTSELQATVLRTRMQPVGNLFGKFPRVVRDLGRQLGKQVEVTIVGREVELDKTILEQLSDPLTHLVRNSVDHGIETPEQRTAQGKPPIGQLTLTARHGDGQVHIEIRDDGRGINPQAVRAKALSLRLKSEAELDRMSQRELMALILLPGFSTAGQVTDVSGRGVGMDVVKTNLEALEGMLTIDSQLGVGTAMILRVPLTLAIIPCLMIVVDGQRYAVPQREVVEVVCLHPDMPGRLEQAFDTEVYRLREHLLPIVRLHDVLQRPQPYTAQMKAEILRASVGREAEQSCIQYIVVVRHEGNQYGLLVDEVRGTEEIVVKPMQSTMKRLKIFSGATILGDGCVALIANVAGIVEHARVSFVAETDVAAPTTVRDAAEAHRLLLFEYGPQEQFALPLLQIRRIESFDPGRIQRVGEHEYVSVEGVATRILRLDRMLTVSPFQSSPMMHLVLAKFAREPVGILISRIVDSDSLSIELQPCTEQGPGVLGAAMVRNRLTLFLDMHYLLEQLLGPAPAVAGHGNSTRFARVLLIDDTPFFREAVGRYLKAAGMTVTTAVDGQDGLNQAAAGAFELIVCDLEMPVLDGWNFARQVRQRGFSGPLLALSSLSKSQNVDRAKACGYDHYEEKLDPDRLVRTVVQMLAGQPPE